MSLDARIRKIENQISRNITFEGFLKLLPKDLSDGLRLLIGRLPPGPVSMLEGFNLLPDDLKAAIIQELQKLQKVAKERV